MLNLTKLDNLGIKAVESWIIKNKLEAFDKQYLEQIKIWLEEKNQTHTETFKHLESVISEKKITQLLGHRNDYLVPDAVVVKKPKFNYFTRFVIYIKSFKFKKKDKYKPLLNIEDVQPQETIS